MFNPCHLMPVISALKAGGSQVQGQTGLQRKTLSLKTKQSIQSLKA